MTAVAEAPTPKSEAVPLSNRDEAASAILSLLSDEPQSMASISRQLLPREGRGGGKRIHSGSVIRDGLAVLESRRLAQRLQGRGWVRFIAHEAPAEPTFVNFDYEWAVLSVTEMFVDAYQRPVTDFVSKIVNDFQPHLFQTLLVSDRGKKISPRYAVIDGQTRWQAAIKLGLTNPVPCLVYRDLTPEDEARMFASIQRNRKNMTSADRFRAEVFAKDPDALELKRLVESTGFAIGNNTGEIKGVAALEACWRRNDYLLERLLQTLKAAWPDYTPEAGIIRGMHLFFREYPIGEDKVKDVNDEKLVTRLKVAGRTGIEEKARAARQFLGKGVGSERYYGMAIQNAYESRAAS